MNMAAYCRVSTQQEQQLDSLAHQKEFFVRYAQQAGHTLVGLYADQGISGTSLKKREEFKRLLADGARGKFQLVVVKDISRFARNTVDALQSIRTLKALGINTLFLTANMDTMAGSEFVLTLFSAMAQEESANLSKRVKWGKKINAEKGRVPQGLFGYDRVDNFTLSINPGEARIVQKIFSLYCDQGMGCRSISLTLNREGDKTKYGNDWNPRGVRRVLVNPIYCGQLVNHKYEVEDYLTGHQVALPKQEQFLHERPQWALVSPQTFQKAQAIMASRRQPETSPFRESRYSGRHLFSTLIKCAHCGRSFTRKQYTYQNTRIYWRCVTNDQYTAQHCQNRVCLDEGELLSQVGSYLSSRLPDIKAFLSQVVKALEKEKSAPSDLQARERELEISRKRLLTKVERYQELYAAGLLTLEALRQKQSAAGKALEAGEAALRALFAPARQDGTEAPAQAVEDFLTLKTMTNGQLRQIIHHILVDGEGHVLVVLKKWEGQSPNALANWCPQ